jgi:uncharacterized protein YjeT (DUF2065 family)
VAVRAVNGADGWLTAVGLVLVIEGLLPLLSPGTWRQTFERALRLKDGQLRFIGLVSVALGLLVMWLLGR